MYLPQCTLLAPPNFAFWVSQPYQKQIENNAYAKIRGVVVERGWGGGGGETCIMGDVQAAYRLFSDTWTTDRGLLRWLEYFFEYSDRQFISGDQEPALGGDSIGDIWLQLSEFISVFAFLLVNLSVSLTFNSCWQFNCCWQFRWLSAIFIKTWKTLTLSTV